MVSYWWLVKLALLAIVLGTGYKAIYVEKFKSKVWNGILVIVLILGIVSPVKLQPESDRVNRQMNNVISQQKVLPERVIDNSFNKNGENLGIKKEELK